MGQITTGVGLISGINTAQLIDQLMAIESRPKSLIQQRNTVLTTQQVAFQDVNAKLLSLKVAAGSLSSASIFNSTAATSSDESVLTATTTSSANPGTYAFSVARLVTSQQTISKGFADKGATAIAPTGGTLTFEFGDARLDADTSLSQLNGGAGITRGKIRITDRSGASAVIDLSKAVTVDDVLDAINGADNINVTAAVSGDGFVLTDNTGAATTALAVTDVNNSGTRATLGLNVAAVGNTLTSGAVNNLGDDSLLATLNDNNGVRRNGALADFRLTLRDGSTFDVALGSADTIADVASAIETATAGVVTVDTTGAGLQLTDGSAGATTFAVTALNSSQAAADLGILTTDTNADGVIAGSRVLANLNSRLLKNLNGGTGASAGAGGSINITNRLGATTAVNLASAQSIDDVIKGINAAAAGVTATLNTAGNGILLTDTTGATTSNLIVADTTGTLAADLNLAGSFAAASRDSGNLQFQYINEGTTLASLRGGKGVAAGKFTIRDSNGASATIDLTQGNETTIADVLSEINSKGLLINARINDNGDGILIEDTGPGTVKLLISEDGSTTAKDLGILGEATNLGDDIDGTFERTVTLTATDTLQDIADKINEAGIDVTASIINDGSPANPFRLSINAEIAGKAGAFVLDDGGIGLGVQTLNEAENGLIFYGSTDPAKAIAITTATSTLTTLVPGATIDLKSASDNPVTLSITRDDSKIVSAVKELVSKFNEVVNTINKYDTFDEETEKRGLLLGDPTLSLISSSLFGIMTRRNTDVSSQFSALAQVGVTIGKGGVAAFNEAKFRTAFESDPDAIEQLFSLKETETDTATGQVKITAGGVGVRIDELLKKLTEVVLDGRTDQIDSQIKLNSKRIESLDLSLANKRERFEFQFAAMEKALASIQTQSSALNSLAALAAQAQGG